MRLTDHGTDSTGRLIAFPSEGEAETRAMLRRIEVREPCATADPLRLAVGMEHRRRQSGLTSTLPADAEKEAFRFTELAEELRAAVARLESAEPADLLAKASLAPLWQQEGEPGYAGDLARTLYVGLAGIAAAPPSRRSE